MNRGGLLLQPSKRKGTISSPLLSKRAGNIQSLVSEREYVLKQRWCLQALHTYFTEAQNTVELIRQHCQEPTSIAKHLQVIAQRDREAEAQREYLQARKLLLHIAKISSLPSKRASRQ
jgi:hypothetical protein